MNPRVRAGIGVGKPVHDLADFCAVADKRFEPVNLCFRLLQLPPRAVKFAAKVRRFAERFFKRVVGRLRQRKRLLGAIVGVGALTNRRA